MKSSELPTRLLVGLENALSEAVRQPAHAPARLPSVGH